jgi:hypothetical protein
MDELVNSALKKWPNVPHCYGWLGLDARGQWRMRDEQTQALGLAGDIIHHPALRAFINRNYDVDEQGQYFFQNGPQRVYVDLQSTPYILRWLDGLQLHTEEIPKEFSAAFLSEDGELFLQNAHCLAQVDDRDLTFFLDAIHYQNQAIKMDDFEQHLNAIANQQVGLHLQLCLPQHPPLTLQTASLKQLLKQAHIQAQPRFLK